MELNKIKHWIPKFKISKNKNLYPRSIEPFRMLMIALSNSGKTYLIKYLYKNYLNGWFHNIMIFSRTMITGNYDIIDTRLKFEYYDAGYISRLVTAHKQHFDKTGQFLSSLIIFDDFNEKIVKYDKEISNCYNIYRNIGISCIFSTQYFKILPTEWRLNYTHLFIFKNTYSSLELFIEHLILPHFAHIKKSSKELIQIISDVLFDIINRKHTCYLLTCEGKSFMYKAPYDRKLDENIIEEEKD